MKLQTQIPLEKQSNNLLDYSSNVLLLGSCFVENIGEKLDYFKFKNSRNPFGILFHPKAIEALITNAVDGKTYSENDIFIHNGQWHCFEAHSKLSNTSKESLLETLNAQVRSTHQQICESTHVIITLGTAWVYRFIKSDEIVANCHKMPQKQFKKELMAVDAIYHSIETIVSSIRKANSKASIFFTVSPVRHIKDGFVENMQSKAHLISAIHQVIKIQSSIINSRLEYFPSYEIIMDELRDYRFYAEDMIHPNQTAINYIWEAFKKMWISSEVSITMKEVDAIQKGLQHKPFNFESEQHQKFIEAIKEKQIKLQKKYTHIIF